MTFRTRLLIAFALTVIVAVAFVGAIVSTTTQRAFEQVDEQRVSALAAQFRQELLRRKQEIAQHVRDIAEADSTRDMVIALNRPDADPPAYVDAAEPPPPTISIFSSWSPPPGASSRPSSGPRDFSTRKTGSPNATTGTRGSLS